MDVGNHAEPHQVRESISILFLSISFLWMWLHNIFSAMMLESNKMVAENYTINFFDK